MSRFHRTAVRLYRCLLRLYPESFHAEFGDEMEAVFAEAVNQVADRLTLLGLVAGELRDLPFSIIREHLRERPQSPLPAYEGGYIMQRLYSPRLFRFCALAILVMCGLYMLSAVSAYFAFDMHIHSLENSYEWWYDYDNNPAFIGRQFPISLFVLILYILTLPSILLFGGALGLNTLGRWRGLTLHERRLALIALGVGVLTLISLNTPIAFIGSLWFYD